MTRPLGRQAANREKVMRWYWCSVFSNAYDNAANSQASLHVTEVSNWLDDGPPPRVVEGFRFDLLILRDVTYRQRSLYRGVITLVQRQSQDFHSKQRITSNLILENNIDDHHVFPDSYLRRTRPDVIQRTRECILNRTLIDRITNIRISDKAPSVYLKEIVEEIGADSLDGILRSHMLPAGPESPLLTDDFDAFLTLREDAISARISEVAGAQLGAHGSKKGKALMKYDSGSSRM